MSDRRPQLQVPAGLPAPGELFASKYRIEGVLGVGGMGAVLAARHVHLDERVAIKVMLPEAANDASTSVRFLREARAAVKIKSEHVAKVLDFGQLDGGQPYMVMEYLTGEDLAATLDRRGRLSVQDTVDYLLQASEAVAQAHALGIVHRDLKPGNLFLTRRDDGSPCVKVLDFGISKATHRDGSLASLTLTKTQSVVGSPMYMAPEQMRTNQTLDARTDIWSLGVVAYELLTGRLPFSAETMTELCAMVLQDPVPPMDRPDVPPDLEAAIRRCLEKKPADRFPDLSAFVAGLAPFASSVASEVMLRISRAHRSDLTGPTPFAPISMQSLPEPHSKPDARTAASWTGATTAASGRKVSRPLLAVGSLLLLGVGGVAVWVALGPSTGGSAHGLAPASSLSAAAPSSAAAGSSAATSAAPTEAENPIPEPTPRLPATTGSGSGPASVTPATSGSVPPAPHVTHPVHSATPPAKKTSAPPVPSATVLDNNGRATTRF